MKMSCLLSVYFVLAEKNNWTPLPHIASEVGSNIAKLFYKGEHWP